MWYLLKQHSYKVALTTLVYELRPTSLSISKNVLLILTTDVCAVTPTLKHVIKNQITALLLFSMPILPNLLAFVLAHCSHSIVRVTKPATLPAIEKIIINLQTSSGLVILTVFCYVLPLTDLIISLNFRLLLRSIEHFILTFFKNLMQNLVTIFLVTVAIIIFVVQVYVLSLCSPATLS
jgi:hypothetical protein